MRVIVALALVGCASGGPDIPDPPNNPGADIDAATADAPPVSQPDAPLGVTSIEIYSGDGALVMGGWPGGDPLKVIVLDPNGNPRPGVTVSWQVVDGDIALTGGFQTGLAGTADTDAAGISRVGLRGEFLSQMTSAVRSTIRASIPEGSVDFIVFSTYWAQQIPSPPYMSITTPQGRDLGIVAPGSVTAGALVSISVFQAGSNQGQAVQGVGMRFVSTSDPSSDAPTPITCANATNGARSGGTVFSDATGHATCDMRVPSTPGNYSIGVRVGGAVDFIPFTLRVQ